MTISILTPRFPFPENGGDVLRINNIARYLKAKGHQLILCSFAEDTISYSAQEEANTLYDIIHTVKRNKLVSLLYSTLFFLTGRPIQCGYYYSHAFNKMFKKSNKSETPDLYISHLIRMSTYLIKNKLESNSIIEMTDALSKTYGLSSKTKGLSIKKIIYFFEKSLIAKCEKNIINRFPKVVLAGKSDIDYLGSKSNIHLHTNGIDLYPTSKTYNKNKICFVGNMRTLQNQDAALHFVNDIYSIIKKKIPEAEFHIVGAEPSETIKKLNGTNGIFVTGFVDSVDQYIQDACILVAPVRIAAGIQNKVLIGMACKIPVVLSSLISKAIPELTSEENCFIEDSNSNFAEKCLILMENSTLRNSIANNGYHIIKNNYDWNKKLEGYEKL